MAAFLGLFMRRFRRVGLPITICLASLAAPGCGSNDLESPTAKRLRGLAIVFMDYAVARGSGPKDEETLHKHMGAVHETVLSENHLDPKDAQLFISERDQEPFVFRWGTGISFGTPNPAIL